MTNNIKPYNSIKEYVDHVDDCGGGHDEDRIFETIIQLELARKEIEQLQELLRASERKIEYLRRYDDIF